MKNIFSAIGRFLTSPLLMCLIVSVIVTLFAIWYGAAWSLVIALPLIYDYYIGHRLARLHSRLIGRYAWWRVVYGIWCAVVFAVVVGTIVHMLLFRWETPWMLTAAVVLLWALWSELKRSSKLYEYIYGWVHAIVFATVVATIIQIYWFQMFVIPTGSMESTLLAGDYILVNKSSYGPRVPMTPLSFPFVHNTMPMNPAKQSFSTAWQRDYRRLKGCSEPQRGDVVVFNFPEGDTVVMEMQAMSYYQLLRDRHFGATEQERRRNIAKEYTLQVRPLDKMENYIKRCVAVAGDELEVRDGVVYTNGQREGEIPNKQYYYTVANLRTGVESVPTLIRDSELERYADTTRYVLSKQAGIMGESLIPHLRTGDTSRWSLDNFGPVWVPKAGESIELNDYTMALYGRCIALYEGNDVQLSDGKVYINGEQAESYTFRQDYYFMMGDNRHGSLDSRFWGFVPADHIVGKASYIWFSVDQLTGDIRWDRIFTSIK